MYKIIVNRSLCIVLTAIALSLSIESAALAQSDKSFVAYRQKIMKSIGANMGAISDIFKRNLPFTGNIQAHAQNIHNNANMIQAAFQRSISSGRTDAKPKIWADWTTFKLRADDLKTRSAELASVAAAGGRNRIMNAVKALGKACRECHDLFRKPEKQRFKR